MKLIGYLVWPRLLAPVVGPVATAFVTTMEPNAGQAQRANQ